MIEHCKEYIYERRLRKLRKIGYRKETTISAHSIYPDRFKKYEPNNTLSDWVWRGAIKKYLENETKIPQKYNYKIVRAVGFWRNIYPLVYEVWIESRGE